MQVQVAVNEIMPGTMLTQPSGNYHDSEIIPNQTQDFISLKNEGNIRVSQHICIWPF